MKPIRRASEAEVIAEFLKNEFYLRDFHEDRAYFESLVMHGDITDEHENALRRALLFRRRGGMMRELPPDTEWWAVHLEQEDLERIVVFPRAHWRKVADGDFRLTEIVEKLRARVSYPELEGLLPTEDRSPRNLDEFLLKIQTMSQRLSQNSDRSSVILIGTDEVEPMLIFEGNHRFTASLIGRPDGFNDFQFFVGSSPQMVRCCWYRTSFLNLLRYAKNRVLHLGYDQEADIARVLQELSREPNDFLRGEILSNSGTAQTNLT